MALDLIDRRGDLVVLDQIDETVWVEVRHTDRTSEALAVEFLCLPLALILDPQLGRDEHLLTRDGAGRDRAADRLFVLSSERIAGLESIDDGLLCLVGRNLEDTKPRTGISTPLFKVTVGIAFVTNASPCSARSVRASTHAASVSELACAAVLSAAVSVRILNVRGGLRC